MRIFLTGFMGAGKTTVGQRLATRLELPFVDLDHEVELRAGASVRDIFERQGEAAFQEVLKCENLVVATGGGTMAWEASARLVQAAGLSVWLNPDFSTIVRRIGGLGKSDRPLFRDEAQALALYRERLAAYRRADVAVDVAAAEAPEEVAARIALLIGERRCAT